MLRTSRVWRELVVLSSAICTLAYVCHGQGLSVEGHVATVQLNEEQFAFRRGDVWKVVTWGKSLFFVDMSSSCIHKVENGRAIQIGGIGNRKGEFYHPFDLALDDDGNLYVNDMGNGRIQVLDQNGNYLREIPLLHKGMGFAVQPDGTLYLGIPAMGNLITTFDRTGTEKGGFGRLVEPSEVYGPRFDDKESKFRLPMNRVHLETDDAGNVWAAFVFMPLVCKFDRKGNLLFKKTIVLPQLDPRKDRLWELISGSGRLSVNWDGIQMTVVIKDMTFDAESGEMMLLLMDERLVCLDPDGRETRIQRLQSTRKDDLLNSFSVCKDGVIYASLAFSSDILKGSLYDLKKEGR